MSEEKNRSDGAAPSASQQINALLKASDDALAAKPGRRVVLDVRRQGEVCAIIGVGCSMATAAKYVGCRPTTISSLKKRRAAFRNAMLQAQARHEITLLRRIHEASGVKNGWRAAAWLLSRSYPDMYSNRAAETVTPRELADSMQFFADEIARNVKDSAVRKQIRRSLQRALKKIASDRPTLRPEE